MTLVLLALLATSTDLRPTDDALRAAVAAERPGARVLSLDFKESLRGGARIGCGLIEVAGVVEPVSVVTSWRDRSAVTVTVIGVPPQPTRPPEPPHWEVRVVGPTGSDHDQNGEIDRYDRNRDALGRVMAKTFCPELAPPPGVAWAMEIEPDPDPSREAEARRRAKAATDLIFGAQPRPTQPEQ